MNITVSALFVILASIIFPLTSAAFDQQEGFLSGTSWTIPPTVEEGIEHSLPFPRLANYFLIPRIRRVDINLFSGWDLFCLDVLVDREPDNRLCLDVIDRLNPDIVFLVYHHSHAVNVLNSPPEQIQTAAEEYDWWLRDYQGNILTDPEPWTFNHMLNMTNEEAAIGSNPQGIRPNEFLPMDLVVSHLRRFDFWDGIFYDIFSDHLGWIYPDIKDANRNGIPEYDAVNNGNEPIFQNIWRNGMITLVQNTLRLQPDAILVGNGLHKTATRYLNGKMFENYKPSGCSLSDLAAEYMYIQETRRDQAITIINGTPRIETDPTDYASMRFALASSLLIGAYLSFDFGSRYHGETLWFDEYSVLPNGSVEAATTYLAEDIDATQIDIPVFSTTGFPESGVIVVDGEQIYYDSKTARSFHASDSYFGRGYPAHDGKYDLRAPHASGATVIHYFNSCTGYLGNPLSGTYDANDPNVKLRDLFEECGWDCNNVEGLAEEINSRIWRKDFEKGAVLLNASDEPMTAYRLGDGDYRKIKGLQDPGHNDGSIVYGSLTLGAEDGIILLRTFQ